MHSSQQNVLLAGIFFMACLIAASSMARAADGVAEGPTSTEAPATADATASDEASPSSDESAPFFNYTRRANAARMASALGGGVIGAGVGVTILFGGVLTGGSLISNTGFYPEGGSEELAYRAAVLSTAVFTAAGIVALLGFAELMIRVPGSNWWSLLVGPIAGTVVASFIGALGFSSIFLIGHHMRVVPTGGNLTYAETLGMGLLGGALWGAFFGPLPGLLLGPAIRFTVGEPGGQE